MEDRKKGLKRNGGKEKFMYQYIYYVLSRITSYFVVWCCDFIFMAFPLSLQLPHLLMLQIIIYFILQNFNYLKRSSVV